MRQQVDDRRQRPSAVHTLFDEANPQALKESDFTRATNSLKSRAIFGLYNGVAGPRQSETCAMPVRRTLTNQWGRLMTVMGRTYAKRDRNN